MLKKQPGLYRTPRSPGYLGGYNWHATTLGCLLLVVVNFIATQYIANFRIDMRDTPTIINPGVANVSLIATIAFHGCRLRRCSMRTMRACESPSR